MIKCAFVTFIYPGVESYLSRFVVSLNNQVDKEFELVVHNDGVSDVNKYFTNCLFTVHIVTSGSSNFLENRLWTFNHCKKIGFTHLILGDSDDYFEFNRVSINKKMLEDYNIVVNDISLVDCFGFVFEERVFSRRIYSQSHINFNSIKEYNFIGFTNSAFSIEVLKDIPSLSSNIKVVDWLFFSILLLNGNSAIFTSESVSFYCQHKENITELRYMNTDLAEDKKKFFQNVRKMHFELLNEVYMDKSKFNLSSDLNKKEIIFWWEI